MSWMCLNQLLSRALIHHWCRPIFGYRRMDDILHCLQGRQ